MSYSCLLCHFRTSKSSRLKTHTIEEHRTVYLGTCHSCGRMTTEPQKANEGCQFCLDIFQRRPLYLFWILVFCGIVTNIVLYHSEDDANLSIPSRIGSFLVQKEVNIDKILDYLRDSVVFDIFHNFEESEVEEEAEEKDWNWMNGIKKKKEDTKESNILNCLRDSLVFVIFHNFEEEEVEDEKEWNWMNGIKKREEEEDYKKWNWMNGIKMEEDDKECDWMHGKKWKEEEVEKLEENIILESEPEVKDCLFYRFKTFIREFIELAFKGEEKAEVKNGQEKENVRRWTKKWTGQDQEEEMVQVDDWVCLLGVIKNIKDYFEGVFSSH